ncbi:hypothetical protein IT411_00240 [Candidatus Peregrinibacteria bacterium]|nr:hypothetical protein [Candidatus Peregrinibacteria bacterium]
MAKIITIIGILLGVIGAGIGILAAINPQLVASWFVPLIMNDNGRGFSNFMGVIFPIGMILFFVVVFGLAFRPLIANAMNSGKIKNHLKMVGVKGTARVLSVQDTGITVNNSPFAKITMEIKPGVTAEFSTTIGRLNIPRPGDMIEVVYDPSNPKVAMPASMLQN